MNRVFRRKSRRITALLLAAAVMAGSMDISMLTVRAQEENAYEEPDTGKPEEVDMERPEETADEATPIQNIEPEDESGEMQPEQNTVPEEEQIENGGDTEKIYGAFAADESGDLVIQADAGDDGDVTPAGPQRATVTGILISNKVYDGSPVIASGTLKAVVPKEISSTSRDEDITSQVTFKYSVSGKQDDGTVINEPEKDVPTGSIVDGMPKDAGTYTLTITVNDPSGKYEGSLNTQFKINKRSVTIKVSDKRKRIGDDLPGFLQDPPTAEPEEGKDYTVNGLVNKDKLDPAPTLVCDITEETKDKTGKYTITASGADAGANYMISYIDGVLTVSAKETVTISGITVADKEYDGAPIEWDTSGVKIVGEAGTELTDLQAALQYSISGGQKDGTLYFWSDSSQTPETAEEAGGVEKEGEEPPKQKTLPTEAGTYTLKVTVNSDKYWGEYRKDFTITQKPVTIKANDLDIKQGDEIPTAFTYTVDGLLGKDEVRQPPSYTCDIFSTEKTGTYTIIPRDASAGANYKITYIPGTLTVLEKDRLTITGLTTTPFPKVYDGKPVVCNTGNLKVLLHQSGKPDEDITNKVDFDYSIKGTMANGKGYSSPNIVSGMPSAAGDYTITVTAASKPDEPDKYLGSMEYSFSIAQRPIIIRADDLEIRTEDKLPERSEYTYEIAGMGLVDDDKLIMEPTFTCDIQNTDMAGEYDIVVSDADAGFNYRIDYESGKLTVVEREIVKTRNLLRIISPASVLNVMNGTSIDNLPLPETITIVTRKIVDETVSGNDTESSSLTEIHENVPVVWDRAAIDGTSYSPRNEEEQTFMLGGKVVLPAEVDENGVSLAVKIEVNVREKYTAKDPVVKPTASIPTGKGVPRGTTIKLSCETEGAEIYYTLDSTKPDRKSNLYANPIEVNVNGFTVIWAYAHKKGQPDSDTVKFYYYIDSQTGGEGDEPEVPKEDIPDDGKIPEGLWVTKIPEYTYTGKAIKPEVRVYDYKTRLEEKKDYTIKYANNVKAAKQDAEKAPSIIITGKGNYEGKLTKSFTILPKDIRDTDISVDDITVAYNSKKMQKPAPAVFWNGKKLAVKKDYTVQDVSYTDAGDYDVTVTGVGNYTGTRTVKFSITESILASGMTVSKIPNQTYTGKAIEPQITVKYKGTELTAGKDYEKTYLNNVNVGTATIVIKGTGAYAGTKKVPFKIMEVASLSKAKAELNFTNKPTYTGKEIKADSKVVTISFKEGGQTVTRTLKEGSDYEVAYTNNVKAGTATVVFTGKNAYSGKLKKTFTIAAYDINKVSVSMKQNDKFSYVKGGCRPEPVVKFLGETLKAGTDYTLAYKQNNAVGKGAILTITGKGNFQGSRSIGYEITQQDIAKMTVTAADKVYKNKKNIYKTTVQVTDTNGKKLSAGKDYDKNISYTYTEDVYDREAKFYKKAGDPVDKDDIIPAGTQITVTVTAKGTDYTGTVSGIYRITAADISGAKVTIQAQYYTGRAITLEENQIQAEIKGTVLKYGEDYEILEDTYSNNINKGTAKVMIRGLGNYGGLRTVTFKIRGKGLFNL